MQRGIVFVISALLLMGCNKPSTKQPVVQVIPSMNQPAEAPLASDSKPLAITHDSLVGTWVLLDSEGELAASHDYFKISDANGEFSGTLRYQGATRNIKLESDGNNYIAISSSGEKYKIYRVRSRFAKENNGIGIDLIIGNGVDDIELGTFQREDILKQLEGQ